MKNEMTDLQRKLEQYKGHPALYHLATGLTYDEIAKKYYNGNKNKFAYIISKLFKKLNIHRNEQVPCVILL